MTVETALRWSHLRTDDVGAWHELMNHLAKVDDTGEVFTPEILTEELGEPGFTPETDSWTIWDGDRLVAYGIVSVSMTPDHEGRVRCHVGMGGVHQDWRGRGIGRELMGRMEERATALARERHPGTAAYLRASGGVEGAQVRRLLVHRGYAVVRYFNDLTRPLPGEPLPDVAVDGYSIVSETDDLEEATLLAHNAAFADHWGATDITAEQWAHYWRSTSGRPDLSSLAVDDEGGRVLAYVLASQFVPGELYVTIVGTRPEARGRGLAAACLARTLQRAIGTGEYATARLDVDSASPTGATRLYERLGFRTVRTFASMQRDVD
ncbi:MAG: GNAT family N-acetyltransferase [Dermatophilaceae bacterium]